MNAKKNIRATKRAARRISGIFLAGVFLLAFAPGPLISDGRAAITPNEVYGMLDLIQQHMDRILRASDLESKRMNAVSEKKLKPMHVYQMAVSCLEAIHVYQKANNMTPVPIVIATPRKYKPADVLRLAQITADETKRIAGHRRVSLAGTGTGRFTGKTPTDVFSKLVTIYLQVKAMSGVKQITPSEVFAQVFRAQADAKSILGKIDPARRYRIDAPESPPGLTPRDVIKEMLNARKSLNEARAHFDLDPIPVPALKPDVKIQPADVFIQSQIVIAEINIIKLATGTVSATPLPIPVKGKKPSDVHQQAVLLEYFLAQIDMLEKTVQDMASK